MSLNRRRNLNSVNEAEKMRGVHELPYTEIVKFVTIILTSVVVVEDNSETHEAVEQLLFRS